MLKYFIYLLFIFCSFTAYGQLYELDFEQLKDLGSEVNSHCIHVIIWPPGTTLCPPENCEQPNPDDASRYGHVAILNSSAKDETRYLSFQPKFNVNKLEACPATFYDFEQDLYAYEGSNVYVVSLKSQDISPIGCFELFKNNYTKFIPTTQNCTHVASDYLKVFFNIDVAAMSPSEFALSLKRYLDRNPEKKCF